MWRATAGMTATMAALLLAAPAANGQAGTTSYGGTTLVKGRVSGTAIGMTRQPDGRLTARIGLGINCRRTSFPNLVVRLRGGPTPQGFTASGSSRLTRRGRIVMRMNGVFDGESATGRIRVRPRRLPGCRGFGRAFLLRVGRPPGGAPAGPRPGVVLAGVTDQTAGGVRLSVGLRATRNGRRVAALWQATMRCGPRAVLTAVNYTPTTRIRSDGTFRRSERYRIRYRDGLVERFRVTFKGRFLADGAVGTLRVRMRSRRPGSRFYPCDSGTRRWSAIG
jgi:hypothetical protein